MTPTLNNFSYKHKLKVLKKNNVATLCTCGHLGSLKRRPAARRRLGPSKTPSKSNIIGTDIVTDKDTDLGASWLPPECLLLPPGCLLGASRVHPGGSWVPSGCLLSASWCLLGASWVPPMCLLVPSGCLLGASWCLLGVYWCLLGTI